MKKITAERFQFGAASSEEHSDARPVRVRVLFGVDSKRRARCVV